MPTEDYTGFENFLNDKIKAHGLTLEKISEQSGITLSHLEALSRGRYENMPPAPYFRGYLIKLGSILDFDPNVWWERFLAMGVIKKSGPEDRLPKNRFAKVSKAKYVVFSAGALLILGYLGVSASRILGRPQLSVTCPQNTVTFNRVVIHGTLTNAEHLDVNGETVQVEADNSWDKELTLEPGPNSVTVSAKKFLGREVKESCQIVYEAPRLNQTPETNPNPNPAPIQ